MRLIIILILLSSCGQKQWSSRGYKKGWIKSDTIRDTVFTKSVSFDTIFNQSSDTTFIHHGKLTEKYFYNNKTNTVYLKGECASDTTIIRTQITRIEPKEKTFIDQIKEIMIIALIALIVFSAVKLIFK